MSKCRFKIFRKYVSSLLPVLLIGIYSISSVADSALDRIEQSLEENSVVEHLSNKIVLDSLVNENLSTYLFDVRTEDEFAVSHLPNAIRLNPDTPAHDLFETMANCWKKIQ